MKGLTILLLLVASIANVNAQWASITFHTFKCVSTNDFDGTDEIKIDIGGNSFDLGTFEDGESKSLSTIVGTLSFKNSVKIQVIEMDGVGFLNDHDYMKAFYADYEDASARGSLIYTIEQGMIRTTKYEITYTVTTN